MEIDCKASYEQYIIGDLEILSVCDAVIMLPRWKESKGAKIERDYAFFCGVPIYYYPEQPNVIDLTHQERKARRFMEEYSKSKYEVEK